MSQNNNYLIVSDIQRFCMHDGPGVRTTVFLQGCPLNCVWCHNPEMQNKESVLMLNKKKCIGCGKCSVLCKNGAHIISDEHTIDRERCKGCGECIKACPVYALKMSSAKMSINDILEEINKDKAFYGKIGGVTISGGEPTYQYGGLIELLKSLREKNISICLETSGMFSSDKTAELSSYVDMFLYDIKDTDKERLKENTGADLDQILNNLSLIDKLDKKTVIRCIMVPGINMNYEHLDKVKEIYKQLNNCEYVELLPYHPYGNSKADQIGIENPHLFEKPDRKEIFDMASYLKGNGVKVKCFGSLV